MSEKDTLFVSSRGLMKSCQFGSLYHPLPKYREIPLNLNLNELHEGDVVYFSAQNLNKNILNDLLCKVVIVVGDDDHTFPYSYFPNMITQNTMDYAEIDPKTIAQCYPDNSTLYNHNDFMEWIESEKIIHCFIQNCAIKHPKITKMPIGMDYHTFRDNGFMPIQQEQITLSIANNAKPFWERIPLCYGNFHLSYKGSKFGYDRVDAIEQIPQDCVVYEPEYIHKYDCYQHQTQYAFSISPHGNGLDCHRTWESLCLGCIPIVKTSVLDGLYDDLPVLIVKEWSDINQKLLNNTIQEFREKTVNNQYNIQKVKLEYWKKQIYAKSTR